LRQSLAIFVQQHDRSQEACNLNELGALYDQMERLEEAANLYQQAIIVYDGLHDERHEGAVRNNLAVTLIKLQRCEEARRELLRAFECKQPLGNAAVIWYSWATLHYLEQASGNFQAAEAAREQAIDSYLAYRRAHGESLSSGARLIGAVLLAIEQNTTVIGEQSLDELAEEDHPLAGKTLVAALRTILRGNRDPALAADPNLSFEDAAELQLLLEALNAK